MKTMSAMLLLALAFGVAAPCVAHAAEGKGVDANGYVNDMPEDEWNDSTDKPAEDVDSDHMQMEQDGDHAVDAPQDDDDNAMDHGDADDHGDDDRNPDGEW